MEILGSQRQPPQHLTSHHLTSPQATSSDHFSHHSSHLESDDRSAHARNRTRGLPSFALTQIALLCRSIRPGGSQCRFYLRLLAVRLLACNLLDPGRNSARREGSAHTGPVGLGEWPCAPAWVHWVGEVTRLIVPQLLELSNIKCCHHIVVLVNQVMAVD